MPSSGTHPTTLSPGAQSIWTEVIAAMQNAEEFGGVESTGDYVALMQAIINECALRRATAEFNATRR